MDSLGLLLNLALCISFQLCVKTPGILLPVSCFVIFLAVGTLPLIRTEAVVKVFSKLVLISFRKTMPKYVRQRSFFL